MTTATIDRPTSGGANRLWNRQLDHYPDTGPRTTYLAITVLATIVLYYELYVQGAVATKIIEELHFSFTQFVFVAVIGNAVGAFASLFAGLADRWGRANLVVAGVLITGLLILFASPRSPATPCRDTPTGATSSTSAALPDSWSRSSRSSGCVSCRHDCVISSW